MCVTSSRYNFTFPSLAEMSIVEELLFEEVASEKNLEEGMEK